jgi:hypothetical protein
MNIEHLERAVKEVQLALSKHRAVRERSSAIRAEELAAHSEALKVVLEPYRRNLQGRILKYLSEHSDLLSDEPGIREIFGFTLEENYTRCLAWLLSLTGPTDIGPRLLAELVALTHGNATTAMMKLHSSEYQVLPEHWMETGRLDILVRSKMSRDFLVIIENKILLGTKEGSGESTEPDLWQLKRYAKWASCQNYDNHILIFLCRDQTAMRTTDSGFKVLKWRSLLQAMRQVFSHSEMSALNRVVFDLFLRDIERFTSPIGDSRETLAKLVRQDSTGATSIPLPTLQEIISRLDRDEG